MRKIILTILLIMSLYCPKVYATPTKIIMPGELTMEKVEYLSRKEKKLSYEEQMTKILNKAHSRGFFEGFVAAISISAIVLSEKEINCLLRPLDMHHEEIFTKYKNGELSNDTNWIYVLIDQAISCIKDRRLKLDWELYKSAYLK